MNDAKKFTQRPNWLFQTKLNLAAREVYTVLLSHAWGGKATVFPSIKRIAEMAGIGRTTVTMSAERGTARRPTRLPSAEIPDWRTDPRRCGSSLPAGLVGPEHYREGREF